MVSELNNFNDLRDYISNKNLNDILSFYELENFNQYFDLLEKQCKKNNATVLVFKDNNYIKGYIIGIITQSDELENKIGIIITMYDNINILEKLVKDFEQFAKDCSCNCVKIQVPKYQNKILEILESVGYNSYRVKLEKN